MDRYENVAEVISHYVVSFAFSKKVLHTDDSSRRKLAIVLVICIAR